MNIWRQRLTDPVFAGLVAALILTVAACFPLRLALERPVFRHIVVVDITRSMNVEDYRQGGRAVSRLAFVRQSLIRAAADLPCGSSLGLGVFTEREPALLFEPIETCAGFSAISAAIEQLDWRMAWAADSLIAAGLRNTLERLGRGNANVIFITDGHEAPPLNPRYRPDFSDIRGKVRGLIVGVGGLGLSPIPKYDASGRRSGFYTEDEVPQRSSFGLSELPPEQIEGYHARNAPFGSERAGGTEHLSQLKETYLRQLAEAAGLGYSRLESPEGLARALMVPALAHRQRVATDVRWIPATLALAVLAAVYLRTLLPRLTFSTATREQGETS
ncbi:MULTISPECIES: vWA domain-containing protein [Methylococcus]|uniref:VWA domain-containing protein n=1 Tax=Methylococcus capsulatus TaxID=414 RepID=A0ABZ2F1N0_METCP|nr:MULTISPECIES: vWA domain-containing protein [Methylococcus]MDF9391474.1 VWA domain-containing protein [Methylococcus capsulatus]